MLSTEFSDFADFASAPPPPLPVDFAPPAPPPMPAPSPLVGINPRGPSIRSVGATGIVARLPLHGVLVGGDAVYLTCRGGFDEQVVRAVANAIDEAHLANPRAARTTVYDGQGAPVMLVEAHALPCSANSHQLRRVDVALFVGGAKLPVAPIIAATWPVSSA